MSRAFRDREREGSFDFEALETKTRDVMHHCGAILLTEILNSEDASSLSSECDCGGVYKHQVYREKTFETVLGPVVKRRSIQKCNICGAWRAAEDVVLDVVDTIFSPGLRRIDAKTGGEVCFKKAREMIWDLAGIRMTAKQVERISESVGDDIALRQQKIVDDAMSGMEIESDVSSRILYIAADGTGIPVLKKETQGRKGKNPDGSAKTREVKLGAVFTQTKTDEKGNPIRDPGSTTYVGKIESVDDFGPRLYVEALRRGISNAGKVVFIGDGAVWLWNLADEHFHGAIQIVDYYHACEHLGGLAKLFYPDDEVGRMRWLKKLKGFLWNGRIKKICGELRGLKARGKKKKAVDREISYFEKNESRMRYKKFRELGLFIGSGVVEAGCKSVIGSRLKQSGMHWTVDGANSIIALRCEIESGRFEEYWESRRAI